MLRRPTSLQLLRANNVTQYPQPWTLPWITGSGEYWDGLIGITVTGSGVSAWAPVVGTHSLLQGTDSLRPTYSGGVLAFDGSDDYLATAGFTLNQPVEYFAVIKPKRYNHGSYQNFANGIAADSGFGVVNLSANVYIYAGGSIVQAAGPAVDSFYVFNWKLNGASSFWANGLNAANSGSAGANNPGGVTIGTNTAQNAPAQCEFQCIGYTTAALSAAQRTQTIQAVARSKGLSV